MNKPYLSGEKNEQVIYIFNNVFLYINVFVSCAKKTLTLDDETSMKTLLNASDKEITDLVIKEASEKQNLSSEDISVEYILRDKKNQAVVVKIKNNQK